MSSVPEGRAANQPLAAIDLDAADRARRCPARLTSTCAIGSPASSLAPSASGDSAASRCFCSALAGASTRSLNGRPSAVGELVVGSAGIAAGARGDLAGEQRRDDAVLVGRPDAAVAAQERGAGALLAAEAERAVEQPVDEPLEADRHFVEPAAEALRDAIDERGADDRLADRRVAPPTAAGARTGSRSQSPGSDSARSRPPAAVTMPCRSWSVSQAKATSKRSLMREQPLHRVRRRRVHADLAVPVERHEAEGRVDLLADDGEVDAVALGDARPVVHAGAAERIDAHPHARARGSASKSITLPRSADVGVEVVVAVRRRRAQRLRHAAMRFTPREPGFEQRVGRRLDPAA